MGSIALPLVYRQFMMRNTMGNHICTARPEPLEEAEPPHPLTLEVAVGRFSPQQIGCPANGK